MSEYHDPVVLLKMVRRLQGVEDEAIALAQMNDKLRYQNAHFANTLTMIAVHLQDALDKVQRWRER